MTLARRPWVRIPLPPLRGDRCPSGLRSTIGNRVGVKSPSWVRIPPDPLQKYMFGTWLSPVEHSLRERGVGGSNPPVPTEGYSRGGVVLTGKAPHSKCGAGNRLGVRVPPPPLCCDATIYGLSVLTDRGAVLRFGRWPDGTPAKATTGCVPVASRASPAACPSLPLLRRPAAKHLRSARPFRLFRRPR